MIKKMIIAPKNAPLARVTIRRDAAIFITRNRRHGQSDEDKSQHDQAIKYALDDDSGDAGADRNIFTQAQYIRAQQFAGSEGENIVAHVTNDHDWKEAGVETDFKGRSIYPHRHVRAHTATK